MARRSPGLCAASDGELGSLPRFEDAAGTGLRSYREGGSGCWASERSDRALLDLATRPQQYTADRARGKREDRRSSQGVCDRMQAREPDHGWPSPPGW
jgi:hypothetical protein